MTRIRCGLETLSYPRTLSVSIARILGTVIHYKHSRILNHSAGNLYLGYKKGRTKFHRILLTNRLFGTFFATSARKTRVRNILTGVAVKSGYRATQVRITQARVILNGVRSCSLI